MRKLLLIFIGMLPLWVFGTGSSAESLYKEKKYEEAARVYEKMLEKGSSASLLYNIGNCYYKNQDWGKAILYYEKALRLEPTNDDILHNLSIAGKHASDKSVTPSPGLGSWFVSVLSFVSADGWSYTGLAGCALALALYIMYRFTSRRVFRLAAQTLTVCGLVSLLTGYLLTKRLQKTSEGIVLTPSIEIRTTPDSDSRTAFILHEGAHVHIKEVRGHWIEIRFDETHTGWIPDTDLGII